MATQSDTRTDTVVLIFSTLAVLIAATLSMATISTNHDDPRYDTQDPIAKAEAAADAGVEAARWHIECHGRTAAGGLTPKYYINGATYKVEWDDVNLADSTVKVRSTGDFTRGDDKHYEILVESRIKLEFMPSHHQDILKEYYSQN